MFNPPEGGFTLIELVVAISIFAIIMIGIAGTLGAGLRMTGANRRRTVAANLAAQEMDVVRSSNFQSLVPRTLTQNVDSVPYTVHRELTWVAKSATSGPCDASGGATPQLLRVHVAVDWPTMRGVDPIVSDTTLSPPVGSYDPNTGHISVRVRNRDAQPLAYATVSLTGPTTRTLPTNSDGCAFFTFLPAGTYTVSLTDSGYVDRQSNPSPAQIAGVSIGNITAVQYDFDLAATLQLTLQPPAGTTPPNDLPLTLYNTQFLPNGQKAIAGTGTVRTLTNLFPALEGYQSWAGICADADPEGIEMGTDGGGNPIVLGPYWPTADRANGLATVPGGTSAGTVALGGGNMDVTRAGLPVVGAVVTATHANDAMCTGETHVLGVTDAAGQVHTALPYGTWTISVAGSTPVGGVWPKLVVDPTAGAIPTLAVPLV